MPTRYFSLIIGIAYLVAGLLGFVPGATTPHQGHNELAVNSGYGLLLGLFPINVIHNLVHIGIGLWGLYAYRSLADARFFSRGIAIVYGSLAIFGLIPGLRSLFGLVPLWGHDVWLHAATTVIAAYFGWFRSERGASNLEIRRAA